MPDNLSFENQLSLLKSRGMVIDPDKRDESIHTLKTVSYYRIKEFAKPFEVTNQGDKIYHNLEFSKVLARYYQDKNLRMGLLYAIELLEVSIKTQLAFALGTRYGAFGYLEFSNWIDRSRYDNYQTLEKQYFFTKDLKVSSEKSNNADLHNDSNLNQAGLPSVWLGVNILTFGQMCSIIYCAKKEILSEIASNYNCTNNEFKSWIGMLNLVRNVCAHNGNLVNISLKKKPLLNNELESYIFIDRDNHKSFKLGIVVMIIKTLVNNINPKYQWDEIRKSLKSLCVKTQLYNRDEMANIIGFKDFSVIKSLH